MNVSGLEAIQRDYHEDVDFYYIYKTLAHPNLNGYVEPHTLAERVLHVKEASRTLDTQWTWLIDNMDNEFKHAMGGLPNSEFVIDPEGKVTRARVWSNTDELRADLEDLIGPVENPTTIDELDMKFQPPPVLAPSGVVEGVERERRMRSLRVVPKPAVDAEEPFYVKLRVEAANEVVRTGDGDIVLSFRPDLIYGVHWNNMVDPIRVEIEAPDGVEISETELTGPNVTDHEADVDPREFLIEVNGGAADVPLIVTAHYFACTDEWCRPFTNVYELYLDRDGDGGTAMTRRMDFIEQQGARGGGRRQGGGTEVPPQIRQRFQRMDADGDGRLTREELPDQMRQRFERMDADADGFVTLEEMAAMRRQAGQRGGGGGRGGGGLE